MRKNLFVSMLVFVFILIIQGENTNKMGGLLYAQIIDTDGDGIDDVDDNCPYKYNPDQLDTDNDGVGDSCDNCIDNYNPSQEDIDNDGRGDACCCEGMRGDNCDGFPIFDIGDLVFFVDYMFYNGSDILCFEECDIAPVPSLGGPDGIIDIGDLVAMVEYQFGGGESPGPC